MKEIHGPCLSVSPLQVIWCFLYSLYTQLYVSGAVVALFVEVNSVTLHLRLMLKLAGAQSSTFYHVNKFVNLLTYVTFRLSTQFYLTWYILDNYSWLDHSGCFLLSLMVMNIMILIYFYRLLRADFCQPRKSSEKQNGTHSSRKFLSDWLREVDGTTGTLYFYTGWELTCFRLSRSFLFFVCRVAPAKKHCCRRFKLEKIKKQYGNVNLNSQLKTLVVNWNYCQLFGRLTTVVNMKPVNAEFVTPPQKCASVTDLIW